MKRKLTKKQQLSYERQRGFRDADIPILYARYLAGETTTEIARSLGCNQINIWNAFHRAALAMRSASKAMKLRWMNSTPAQRKAMVAPAHASRRKMVREKDESETSYLKRCKDRRRKVHRLWYERNRGRAIETAKRWRRKKLNMARAIGRRKQRRNREGLKDEYIKSLLMDGTHFRRSDIPSILIEAKRLQLKGLRIIHQMENS